VVGRFLQEDVYQGDGLNLYVYCGNNPVMYYDPSGYTPTGTGGYEVGAFAGDDGEREKYYFRGTMEGRPEDPGEGPSRRDRPLPL